MTEAKKFSGKWRITQTDLWDRDALDMMVPAHITFRGRGGRFEMICVVGELDCEFSGNRVEFTWEGNDEMDHASGRGLAEIGKDGKMRGKIHFHGGDKTGFVATRTTK